MLLRPPIPRHQRIATSLAIAIVTVGASAQSKLPPVDPKLRARFGFLDPVIKKLGPGTNLLQPVRWREKGPVHLMVHNPHRARIENLLLKNDKLEGEPFSTPSDLRGLVTADIDGKGLLDTLMLTTRGRLVIRTSAKSQTEIEVGRGVLYDSIKCGDIDGDGKVDAVILTKDGVRTATQLATKPKLGIPEPVFASRTSTFELFDLDGDGRLDIVLANNDTRMQLHIKRGDGKGGFGPWIILDPPRMVQCFPGTGAAGAPTLAVIEASPRRVVEYRLERSRDADRPALMLDALPATTSAQTFVYGDYNGDGKPDLIVSDPDRARLSIFFEADGAFQRRSAATLAGIQGMALGDIDADGKTDLIIASAEEKSLSWVCGTTPFGFPRRLVALPKIKGKPAIPVGVAVHDGKVLVLARNKSRHAALLRVSAPTKATSVGANPGQAKQLGQRVEVLMELKQLRRDPVRLVCEELDGQPGPEVAFVVPGVGLTVLFARDGRYHEAADTSGAGFTQSMADGALTVTGPARTKQGKSKAESSTDSTSRRELLVVRERYARRFRFDDDGHPIILDQHNGPEGSPTLAMGIVSTNGSRFFLAQKKRRLFRCRTGRPDVSIDLPDIGATHLIGHGRDVLILGRQGVLRIPYGRSLRLQKVRSHEPPTTRTSYGRGVSADLDGDGKPEIAVLDARIHGLHVLVPKGDKLVRALSFPVFQSDEPSSVFEPRALKVGDLNNDGRLDLLILAHDRVLVYCQER